MSLFVVAGNGPVGATTARLLADRGHDVRVVTRSGTAPAHPRITPAALDVADAAALAQVAGGAAALISAINPPYHRWATDWPPRAAAMLAAAERTGAVLVTMSNLYGYSPAGHPMREDDPLDATHVRGRVRAQMWRDALAAHQAGRARVTEARASDYFGPGVTSSHAARVVPGLLAGKRVWVIGSPDQPHSWTYLPDVARALVTLATDERAWGQAWHVPSPQPLTQRQLAERFCAVAAAPTARMSAVPRALLRVIGLASPMTRGIVEMDYQFTAPFVVDSSRFTATFAQLATDLDAALAATAAWWRERR